MADERDELDALLQGVRVNEGSYEDQGAGGFDAALVARARSLRARERKLAELAMEMYHINNITNPRVFDRAYAEWLKRYESAVGVSTPCPPESSKRDPC